MASSYRRATKAARLIAAAFFVTTALIHPKADAQDTPVIFLHGLAAKGSAWTEVSTSLAGQFRIAPTTPTIGEVVIAAGLVDRGGFKSVASMASELQPYLAGASQIAVIAHSVGGVVARQSILDAVNAGQPQRISKLATIATPHAGAPIAQAMLGDLRVRPLYQQMAIMDSMMPYYGLRSEDVSDLYVQVWWPAVYQFKASHFPWFTTALRLLLPTFVPVTADMNPSSSTVFPVLNYPGNLVHENSVDRVSVVGVTTNDALFFKALVPVLWPDWPPALARSRALKLDGFRKDVAHAVLITALAYGLNEFLYYLDHPLPPCITDAMHTYEFKPCLDLVDPLVKLLGAYYVLDNMNSFWAGWVGAHGDNTSDGWLPDSTQQYPGLPDSRRLVMGDAWHGIETRESGTVLATVLSIYWSIPARIAPIAPLANQISSSGYTYTASPTGGHIPYSFLWEWCALDCNGGGGEAVAAVGGGVHPNTVARGWNAFATSQSVYFMQRLGTLRSTVTDATGAQAVATLYIH